MKVLTVAVMASVVAGLSAGIARATPVLSDSFAYADNGALQSVWGINASLTSGLTFGPLASSGGAVAVNSASAAAVLGTNPGSGAFWASYLVRPTSPLSGGSWGGGGNTVASSYTGGPGLEFYAAKSNGWGSYGFTAQDKVGTPVYNISQGTTYLAITYLSQNGQAGNWQSAKPTKYWLFTESAFTDWVTAGKTEAGLDTYAVSKATSSYGGQYGFAGLTAASTVQLRSTGGSAVFDEYRSGTTLGDVISVPEPTLIAFAGVASLVALHRRRQA